MDLRSLLLMLCLVSFFKGTPALRPVLSVSPQTWVTEGDSVTLSCEVPGSSSNLSFSWYRVLVGQFGNCHEYFLESSRGAEGSYMISPAAVHHTGLYMCRVPDFDMDLFQESHPQPVWINGQSPSVFLIISPTRTQHFTGESLSLSCVDEGNSTEWKLNRYTEYTYFSRSYYSSFRRRYFHYYCRFLGRCPSIINSLDPSDTGVYWCASDSGDSGNPVNITVHDTDVILDSPVHPVTEGDPLTLRCLYHYSNYSSHASDFYKDGSILQSQTTGELTISAVSRSDEGFYYCNHSVGGMSPKSWVSVRDTDVILDSPVHPVTEGDPLTLHCLYRYSNSSIHTSDFYKNGSILQSQTTGELTISAVSRSDEGFYYCKHSVGGTSLKSWVSVRVSDQSRSSLSVLKMISSAVAASPYLLSTVILLVKCYRA